MKIGIFGGTFNPVHTGHLIVAEQIRELFSLACIYFMPSSIPPHKETSAIQETHRLNMVRLATDANPYFTTSSLEVDRGGISYTIDTIREMKKNLGEGNTFYFIVGADAFRDITTWKEYTSLLKASRFIVISRPGADLYSIQKGLSSLFEGLMAKVLILNSTGLIDLQSLNPESYDIFFVPVPLIDISSTTIREQVKMGRSIRYQVPEAVDHYIQGNRLYR